MSIMERELESADVQRDTTFFAWTTAILSVAVLLVPWFPAKVIGLVMLVPSAWNLVFHGSTLIAMRLEEPYRAYFQVIAAVALPAIASWYFIRTTPQIDMFGLLATFGSLWTLFILALIAAISWQMADSIDKTYPLRGFIGAATILFLVCAFEYHGIYNDSEDDQDRHMVVDKVRAQQAAATGQAFADYLAYVATSYISLTAKLRKRRRDRA